VDPSAGLVEAATAALAAWDAWGLDDEVMDPFEALVKAMDALRATVGEQ
jgi:hypothetical protein